MLMHGVRSKHLQLQKHGATDDISLIQSVFTHCQPHFCCYKCWSFAVWCEKRTDLSLPLGQLLLPLAGATGLLQHPTLLSTLRFRLRL